MNARLPKGITVGILGGGNMGEALLSGVLKNHLVPKNRILIGEADASKRRTLQRRYGVFTTGNNRQVVERSHVIILAVKPQQMEEVLKGIIPLRKRPLVISIAAGVRLSFLKRHLGNLPMIRVMPNLAAAVGEAISAMSQGNGATRRHRLVAEKIFQSVGEILWTAESQLDAVTALSGSGPAYVAAFMKALEEGAGQIGLPRDLSLRLIQKTFQGSTSYLLEKGLDPESFIKKVASKGGTTEAALSVFRSRGLSQTVALALRRALERSRQLSRG